jgi:hypothetical protein
MISHHNRNRRRNLHGLELRTVPAPKKTPGSFFSAAALDFSSYGICSLLHAPGPARFPFPEMLIPILPMFIIMDNREII